MNNNITISQKEFEQSLKKYDKLESKGSFYPMFLNMIEKGFDTEAFLFILSTWNFAVFRYVKKDFDINGFKETINGLKVLFDKFKGQTLEKINFDKYKNDIIKIFETLSKIKGVKYTGASKIMHIKVPEVFIMWDRYIRKAYGFKKEMPRIMPRIILNF